MLQKPEQCGKIKTNQRRIACPVCQRGTVAWYLPGQTVAKDLPVFCKLCGRHSVVNISLEPAP